MRKFNFFQQMFSVAKAKRQLQMFSVATGTGLSYFSASVQTSANNRRISV
ncbi:MULTISPECIES: hypothetical protein [unclassified Lysinibacillus]